MKQRKKVKLEKPENNVEHEIIHGPPGHLLFFLDAIYWLESLTHQARKADLVQ